MATFSAPGIGSNLDVNGIVSQLMAAERRPLALLAQQEARLQGKLSAFGTLKGALAALQGAASALDSLERFRVHRAEVGDRTLLTAAAQGSATPGSYTIEVQTLAQSHKLRSAAYASTAQDIGDGSLTFQFGSYDSLANTFTLNAAKAARTVAIAAGEGTLAGVRDAVNAAKIGVTASIINDGSGNRLVFSSDDMGLANSLKVTVADNDGTHTDASGLSVLAYDPTAAPGSGKNLTESAAALDATLTIDGVAIAKASNSIGDAIEGVTLNLLKAAPGTTTSLVVARDTQAVKGSVQGFVKAYNDLVAALGKLTAYNAESKQGGALLGDALPLGLASRLRAELGAAVSGAPASLANLSQLGVTVQKDGSLALDAVKFDAAAAAGFDDIAGLFTRLGRPTHTAYVAYAGASDDTLAGSYDVAVTQAATRGTLAGGAAAGLTITAGVNDSLTFSVNGISASVTLAAGTYASAAALAAELQTRLNGAAELSAAGASVSVSESAGVLSVTSATYGSSSAVSVAAGVAASSLLGETRTATAGLDVAGSINGAAASGAGQVLTAAAGQPSAGLRLTITAAAAGSYGSVAYSIGHASKLAQLAEQWLGTEGSFAGRVNGLNARLRDIDRRRDAFNERMDKLEQRYRAQFTALDAMIARMQSTGNFLTNQLAALPKIGND